MRVGAELAANPRGVPTRPVPRRAARLPSDNTTICWPSRSSSPGGQRRSLPRSPRTLTALGADVFLANIHLSGVDDARLRSTLTRYADEVVPRVRRPLAAAKTPVRPSDGESRAYSAGRRSARSPTGSGWMLKSKAGQLPDRVACGCGKHAAGCRVGRQGSAALDRELSVVLPQWSMQDVAAIAQQVVVFW